ncbi:MAG TPA: 50S ribosomal protein L4 [Candidatus Saccharimonadia bacterium]|nr:50S ribosomal protein L4 [Candidatus Saccharimonadia bacterium]
MSVSSFTKTGTKSATIVKLDKTIFDAIPENHELIKLNYVAYLANSRDNLAVTKTRGLVRGGGKKPWRQKGTGRARVGSSRSPIWRSGGITFGPTGLENYSHKVSKNSKRRAICQCLSLAKKDNKLIIIDDLAASSKTKDAYKFLTKIGVTKNALLVVENNSTPLKSLSNLSNVKVVGATYINVFDLINCDHLVITKPALIAIEKWLSWEKQ